MESHYDEARGMESRLSVTDGDMTVKLTMPDTNKKSRMSKTLAGGIMDPFSIEADYNDAKEDDNSEWPALADINLSCADRWARGLPVAVPLFLLSYSSCISYSQLIAPGELSVVVAGMSLLSCGLTGLIIPRRSKCLWTVSSVDISVTLFYQHIANDIIHSDYPYKTRIATLCLALPVNTVLVSILFLIVGHKKLMIAVSYLPYPVVAGFLASIGWAILTGSIDVLFGTSVHLGLNCDLNMFGHLICEYRWQMLCALAFVLFSNGLQRVGLPSHISAVAPTITAISAFWLSWIFLAPATTQMSERDAWLFPLCKMEPFWKVWTSQSFSNVNTWLLVPKPLTFVSFGSMLLISQALRIAGIEGSTGTIMNQDDEVKTTGATNMVAGLVGGILTSHSPGLTAFNKAVGTKDVSVTMLVGILHLAVWISGLPARNVLPRYMLAGMLMNLGYIMLVEWMWTSQHKVGIRGIALIYSQVICSALFGLLPGIILGYMVSGVMAKVRSIHLSVLKYHVSGMSIRSTQFSSCSEITILDEIPQAIEIIGLEGHLSEGPLVRLSTYLHNYMDINNQVRYLVVDLRSCHSYSVSACALLVRIQRTLSARKVQLYFSNAEPALLTNLGDFGLEKIQDDSFPSLQRALFHCEKEILSASTSWESTNILPAIPEPIGKIISSTSAELESALVELLEGDLVMVNHLVQIGSWTLRPSGEVLTTPGQRDNTLHFCLPRLSKITLQHDAYDAQNVTHPVQLSEHKFGMICGFEGVLYSEHSRITCVVSDSSHMLSVDKDSFWKLAAQYLEIRCRVQDVVAKQLLRQSDFFCQNLIVARGGGWRGAHFDLQTSRVSASLSEIDSRRPKERKFSLIL